MFTAFLGKTTPQYATFSYLKAVGWRKGLWERNTALRRLGNVVYVAENGASQHFVLVCVCVHVFLFLCGATFDGLPLL